MSAQALLLTSSGATWDISTMTYSGKSLSVNAQINNPNSIVFSTDGTKVYTVGGGSAVYQYTLSTPFDLSTGSYSGKSLSLSGATGANGFTMSADGTKTYFMVQGSGTSIIYQYTLSTPFDISTGTYASKSLSVTAQDSQGYSLYMSADGTSLYFAGHINTIIYQYTLSTPFDISTGSYSAKSLNVAAQIGSGTLTGMSMSADGTKVYAEDTISSIIYQYNLSTSFDLSTGVYSGKNGRPLPTTNSTYGLVFSPDGFRAYIAGISNGTLYQYAIQW